MPGFKPKKQNAPNEPNAPEFRALKSTLPPDVPVSSVSLTPHEVHNSVVPSLDTPVCATQTRRFNTEMAQLPNVAFFTISCDLPMAMARFCGVENIDKEKFVVLSDHKDTAFGQAYGTLIPDLRIQSRAVFVVDAKDTLRYVEYVPEVADQPNYDAVLAAAKSL
jgi:thiol peroxidase